MQRFHSQNSCLTTVSEALGRLFAGSHPSAYLATPAWAAGERRTLRGRPHVEPHVIGQPYGRIGWIPFRSDGSEHAAWACVDIDTKSAGWPLDEAGTRDLVLRIHQEAQRAGVRLAWERSKSLGWHGWVFLSAYAHAIQVRGLLIGLLETVAYPVRPLPQDVVCPRTNRAPTCGNGMWAPLYDATSAGPACKFVDPETMKVLPALETLVHLDAQRTPAEVFRAVTGAALERYRTAGPREGGDLRAVLDVLDRAGVTLTINSRSETKVRVRCPLHPSRSGDSAFVNSAGWFHCMSAACPAHGGLFVDDLIAALGGRSRERPESPL